MGTHATQSPEEKMKQVAESTRDAESKRDESQTASVTAPTNTTSKQAIHPTEAALEGKEGAMAAKDKDPRSETRRARFRQIALESAANWERPTKDTVPGLPIRTEYDTTSIPLPRKVLSEEAKKRLKERMIPNEDFRYPYQFPSFSEPSPPKDSRRG